MPPAILVWDQLPHDTKSSRYKITVKMFFLLIPDHDGQKQIVYKRWFWNEDSQVGWDNTQGTQILGHKKKNRSAAQGRGYSRAELANKPNWSQLGVLLACPRGLQVVWDKTHGIQILAWEVPALPGLEGKNRSDAQGQGNYGQTSRRKPKQIICKTKHNCKSGGTLEPEAILDRRYQKRIREA